MTDRGWLAAAAVCAACCALRTAPAQDDVTDVTAHERRAGGDDRQRYFLLEGPDRPKSPEAGYGLLVVLPGGDGGADFLPFVKRICKLAVPPDYLVAQLVAVRWNDAQEIVWPTASKPVEGQKFTTEQFVEAVVEDVRREHRLDERRIYVLGWSSGGPAAYTAALQEKTPLRGAYVAMSVFVEENLPPLAAARDRAFLIDHSPEDQVCAYHFAEQARVRLIAQGARVRLVTYAGGHGWQGDVWGRLRDGLRWLETMTAGQVVSTPRAGRNLLANGGFEQGLEGWQLINNSGRTSADIDQADVREGKQSLRVRKLGRAPMDVVRCDLDPLPAGGTVRVSACVQARNAARAFVKFFMYDADGKVVHDDVDIRQISGNLEWTEISREWRLRGTERRAAVMLAMVGSGSVWIDDVRVSVD